MSTKRYSLFPARIGSLALTQIGAAALETGQTKSEPVPGGTVDRGAIITAFAEPTLRIKSPDLNSLFASSPAISPTVGYRVDTVNAPTTSSSLFQVQPRLDGGVFDSGSTYYQVISTKGFAYIDEIRAEQDAVDGAECDILYAALSPDGQTSPLSLNNPGSGTGVPTFNSFFYLGPVLLGTVGTGTLLEGVTSISFRPGIEYRVKRSSGAPFANIGSIHKRMPEVRIKLDNIDTFYTAFATFFGQTVQGPETQLACYLQAGIHGGSRVAYATTSHIRILFSVGEVSPDSIEVIEDGDASVMLVLRGMTIAVATGVAIA